jgi:hypothetical protein
MTATEPPQLHAVVHTTWSVAQERSHEGGDDDLFLRLDGSAHASDDWIDLDGRHRVNLACVTRVHIAFGTYAAPNYQALLSDADGQAVRVSGPLVLRLQDELLRRTREHALLDRALLNINLPEPRQRVS